MIKIVTQKNLFHQTGIDLELFKKDISGDCYTFIYLATHAAAPSLFCLNDVTGFTLKATENAQKTSAVGY